VAGRLLLGDLLRAPAAEQPGAGEALHDLTQVLDGVDQVVDVGADVPERLEHREDVLVEVRDQPRQPVDQRHHRLDLGRVQRRGQPAHRRSQRRQRRLEVAEQRLQPADQTVRAVHDAVGAGRRPADPLDGLVGLRLGAVDTVDGGVGLRLRRGDALDGGVGLRLDREHAVDRRVGLRLHGRHRRDDAVGPVDHVVHAVDDAVHPVQQRTDPVEIALHPAERRPQPRDEREGLGDAVPHVGHGREDVGGAGYRRQSHPSHATQRFGGALFGWEGSTPRWGAACRASGVVTVGIPVSSERARGDRPRTGQGRRREGVDTGGGTADVGRRGQP
jgi:hypothetical protein